MAVPTAIGVQAFGWLAFSVDGAIAGVVCARLFDKHGGKSSVFQADRFRREAAVDALRKDQVLRG